MESHAPARLVLPRRDGSGGHDRSAVECAESVRAPTTGSPRYLRSCGGRVTGRLPSASVRGTPGDDSGPSEAAPLEQPTPIAPSAKTTSEASRTGVGGPGIPRALPRCSAVGPATTPSGGRLSSSNLRDRCAAT